MSALVHLAYGSPADSGSTTGRSGESPVACYCEAMPIYEYACQECGAEFEFLVLPPANDACACPACNSGKIERMLSRFAVSSEGIRDANWKSARKKGMKVGLEKQIEDTQYKHRVLKETDTSGS